LQKALINTGAILCYIIFQVSCTPSRYGLIACRCYADECISTSKICL